MKHDNWENLDEKLKSMPKPSLESNKKDNIHESLMGKNINREKEGNGFFKKWYVSGVGGFVGIAALLLFVYIATMFDVGTGDQGEDGGLQIGGEPIVYEFLFEGESENWKGEYYFYGEDSWWDVDESDSLGGLENFSFHTDKIEVTFKGEMEELQSISELEISYSMGEYSGGNVNRTFDQPPVSKEFSLGGGSGSGGKMSEDQIIEVSVKWDGQEDIFELINTGDPEEWEDRGPSHIHLLEKIRSEVKRVIDLDSFVTMDFDWNENGEGYLFVSFIEMVDEDMKDKILNIVDGRFDIEFRVVEFTEEELLTKLDEIHEIIYGENESPFEQFMMTHVGINNRENKVIVGIDPFTEGNIQEVIEYYGDEMIQVVEGDDFGMDEEQELEESTP